MNEFRESDRDEDNITAQSGILVLQGDDDLTAPGFRKRRVILQKSKIINDELSIE